MPNDETHGFGEPEMDCQFSWGGFNLFGDRKSTGEASRLVQQDERCNDLEKIVTEQRARIADLERLIREYGCASESALTTAALNLNSANIRALMDKEPQR